MQNSLRKEKLYTYIFDQIVSNLKWSIIYCSARQSNGEKIIKLGTYLVGLGGGRGVL